MTLTEQLTDYVNAAFTGLYVTTTEPGTATEATRPPVRDQDDARERHPEYRSRRGHHEDRHGGGSDEPGRQGAHGRARVGLRLLPSGRKS